MSYPHEKADRSLLWRAIGICQGASTSAIVTQTQQNSPPMRRATIVERFKVNPL
jgi:hypothetical protein